MTDRKTLYEALSYAAWACVFQYFNINFGRLNILPAFAAYALFLKAIGLLQEERRDLGLLRPLGVLLLCWNLAEWLAALLGTSLNGGPAPVQILGLVVGVSGLYFHFQLFTDFAALAAARQETALEQRLLFWRKWQVIFHTATLLLLYLPMPEWDWWDAVITVMAAITMIMGLGCMMALFALRRVFAPDEQPEEE